MKIAWQIIDWSDTPIYTERKDEYEHQDDVRPFTIEDLKSAARRLPSGKACGSDGIAYEILSHVVRPSVLLKVFNTCLRTAQFPKEWKEARLVLLYKGTGMPTE